MGRTLTAASELDLEPLEVRGGLQRRVRALLSLALPHVEKMPLVVPLASLKEGAPARRASLMNETKKVASGFRAPIPGRARARLREGELKSSGRRRSEHFTAGTFFRAGRDETISCDTYRRDARYRLGSTRTVSVLCVGATEESTQSGTEWSPNVASGASTSSVRRSTSNLRWRKICDGEVRDGQSGRVRF